MKKVIIVTPLAQALSLKPCKYWLRNSKITTNDLRKYAKELVNKMNNRSHDFRWGVHPASWDIAGILLKGLDSPFIETKTEYGEGDAPGSHGTFTGYRFAPDVIFEYKDAPDELIWRALNNEENYYGLKPVNTPIGVQLVGNCNFPTIV